MCICVPTCLYNQKTKYRIKKGEKERLRIIFGWSVIVVWHVACVINWSPIGRFFSFSLPSLVRTEFYCLFIRLSLVLVCMSSLEVRMCSTDYFGAWISWLPLWECRLSVNSYYMGVRWLVRLLGFISFIEGEENAKKCWRIICVWESWDVPEHYGPGELFGKVLPNGSTKEGAFRDILSRARISQRSPARSRERKKQKSFVAFKKH